MLTTIEGTYREGRIHLKETPPGIHHARVLVTFIETEGGPPDIPRGLQGLTDAERTARLAALQATWSRRLSPSEAFAGAKAAEIDLEERSRSGDGE